MGNCRDNSLNKHKQWVYKTRQYIAIPIKVTDLNTLQYLIQESTKDQYANSMYTAQLGIDSSHEKMDSTAVVASQL